MFNKNKKNDDFGYCKIDIVMDVHGNRDVNHQDIIEGDPDAVLSVCATLIAGLVEKGYDTQKLMYVIRKGIELGEFERKTENVTIKEVKLSNEQKENLISVLKNIIEREIK